MATMACRSRTSNRQFDCFVIGEEGSVSQSFVDIARFQIGVVGQDCLTRLPSREQPKETGDRETQPADARLPSADSRVDGDTGESHIQMLPDLPDPFHDNAKSAT